MDQNQDQSLLPKKSIEYWKLEAEKARTWLKNNDYILLPPGSYFKWVKRDKFEEYKPFLAFSGGSWLPIKEKIKELSLLNFKWSQRENKELMEELRLKKEDEDLKDMVATPQ